MEWMTFYVRNYLINNQVILLTSIYSVFFLLHEEVKSSSYAADYIFHELVNQMQTSRQSNSAQINKCEVLVQNANRVIALNKRKMKNIFFSQHLIGFVWYGYDAILFSIECPIYINPIII